MVRRRETQVISITCHTYNKKRFRYSNTIPYNFNKIMLCDNLKYIILPLFIIRNTYIYHVYVVLVIIVAATLTTLVANTKIHTMSLQSSVTIDLSLSVCT